MKSSASIIKKNETIVLKNRDLNPGSNNPDYEFRRYRAALGPSVKNSDERECKRGIGRKKKKKPVFDKNAK